MYAAAPFQVGAVGVVIQQTPATLTGGVALPVESGRWVVTAVGCAEHRPPRDAAGFVAFLQRLPDSALAELVRHAEPISYVAVRRQTANRRHHYEQIPDWPDGLLRKFATVVSLPWAIAASEDLRYPTSTGSQNLPQALLGRWTRQLGRLAIHGNRRAHAVLARVHHLMGSPALLFQPALVAAALRARLTGYGPPNPRPAALDALSPSPGAASG